MGILKVAITVLILVLVPYLLFSLPRRVRNSRSARMRYYIFFFVVALFIAYVVRLFH
jgi:uncharacterized membrane protein